MKKGRVKVDKVLKIDKKFTNLSRTPMRTPIRPHVEYSKNRFNRVHRPKTPFESTHRREGTRVSLNMYWHFRNKIPPNTSSMPKYGRNHSIIAHIPITKGERAHRHVQKAKQWATYFTKGLFNTEDAGRNLHGKVDLENNGTKCPIQRRIIDTISHFLVFFPCPTIGRHT